MTASRGERIGCPEFRRSLRAGLPSRRGLLRAGVLGAAGLSLSQLLRVEARAAEAGKSPNRRSSVIILWMRGGPAQHETWDPKPDAPAEYRGEFGAIRTAVPGIQLQLEAGTIAHRHGGYRIGCFRHNPLLVSDGHDRH